MEKPTVQSNLSGKVRCLILCSPRNHSIDANKSIKDIADQVSPIVKGVIDFAEADYSKAAFIGLFLSAKKLYIVFDYDNPDHNDCRVMAFKVRRHIKPIFVPATEVHKQVKSWKSYPHIEIHPSYSTSAKQNLSTPSSSGHVDTVVG